MKSQLLEGLLTDIDDSFFSPFRGKTVVVTGATGLIGSLVCKAIALADYRLSLGCNLVAVVRNEEKAHSVFDRYLSFGNIHFSMLDLVSGEKLKLARADYILHAAAVTKSKIMVQYPVDVIGTSLLGTESMLELAKSTNARMVYISSMEAYGTLPEGVIADESALGWLDLSSPRSCYPESKRMCECLCNAYVSQFGADVCIARLAQTFGAGVLPGENRAFMQFAQAAMRGENVVLKTRGLSEGNYVNSIDCVVALLMLMANGKAGETYNVANEESHGTIFEVAQLACDVLGDGHSQVVVDVDETNASGYAPDVHLRLSSNKLRGLGWQPKVSLSESFVQLGKYIEEQ